jgi:23S rRNA (cytosine1962-C5)-methyltransferase
MSGAALRLKPGKEKSLKRRHPWVYAAAIAGLDLAPGAAAPQAGDTVAVKDAQGSFLAWGTFAPASNLRVRCWSFEQSQPIDAALVKTRVSEAVLRRAPLRAVSNALRLIFGESDGLPGLVVDHYADQLVVQIHSAGIDRWREHILDALCEASGCSNVFDRSDASQCQREGLMNPTGRVLRGAPPPGQIDIEEHGLHLQVDVRRGHKTGYYIDQRDNRHRVAQEVQHFLARTGRAPRVLNCFCYTGGFSLAAARAGAVHVDSVDASADALALAQSLAQRNGLATSSSQSMAWHTADVFDHLRALRQQHATYDIIILDPPKFATNAHQLDRATRAYKDINLLALQLLNSGGSLFTFSCSGAVDADLFQKVVAGAVFDAGGDALVRARLSAGPDHPVRMTHPEGEYLKGLLLERV